MIVPYIEAGYPGPVPLSAIEEILQVHITHAISRLDEIYDALEDAREAERNGPAPD